jgi:MFS family permease
VGRNGLLPHHAHSLQKIGNQENAPSGYALLALRLSCFGYADGKNLLWMIILGIALHGMAYDFFFVTGQIYIDRRAPEKIRSSAQGLLYFLTLGAGMLAGNLVLAQVNARFSHVVEKVGANDVIEKVTVYDWPASGT